jgi:glycosyltransferase involved in cell wall biosynthesis
MVLAFNTYRQTAKTEEQTMIDFIIPHMGRTELLKATVESIQNQAAKDLLGRIYIVTKNSEPLLLPAHENLTIIYADQNLTISHQRNIGVAQSSTEMIAFLDADIELDENWLTVCHKLLTTHPQYSTVSAMQRCKDESNSVELLRTTLSNTATDQTVSFLPGRNLLTYRKYHDAIGGFPTHLKTCEDYYYTDKIQAYGKLFYTAETHYFHLGEDVSLTQTFQKEIWRSESNLYSIKGRTIPLREWPSILLPFWMLISSLILLAGLQFPIAFIVGAVALCIPVSAYALRLSQYKPTRLSNRFCFIFYTVYFAARTIGTLKGIPQLWLRRA